MKVCAKRVGIHDIICDCPDKYDEIVKYLRARVCKLQMDYYVSKAEVRVIKGDDVPLVEDIIHYCYDHFTRYY